MRLGAINRQFKLIDMNKPTLFVSLALGKHTS